MNRTLLAPVIAAAIALGRTNAGNGMMSVTEMANLTKLPAPRSTGSGSS